MTPSPLLENLNVEHKWERLMLTRWTLLTAFTLNITWHTTSVSIPERVESVVIRAVGNIICVWIAIVGWVSGMLEMVNVNASTQAYENLMSLRLRQAFLPTSWPVFPKWLEEVCKPWRHIECLVGQGVGGICGSLRPIRVFIWSCVHGAKSWPSHI